MDIKFDYYAEQHWDNVASVRVLESTACSKALIDTLRKRCGELAGRRALDMGTGGGALAIDFARHGAEVVGIDVSSLSIQGAEQNADALLGSEPARARLRFQRMDANALAFEAATFDVITFLKAFWVLPDVPSCLAECRRVLVPGGRLAIQLWGDPEHSELVLAGSESIHKLVPSMRLPEDAKSPFEFTPEYVEQLLIEAGFSDIEVTAYRAQFEILTAKAFWELFRSVAGTAYYLYTAQPEEDKSAIDTAWEERTRSFRTDSGSVVLPLEWCILTAVRQ